jgi:hypothetical protein
MTRLATLTNLTESDAYAPVEAARAKLAAAASTGSPASHLNDLVQAVGVAEAVARLRLDVAQMLRENQETGDIRETLLNELLRGADDAWSGRANDLRRATHDGVRLAIRDIIRALDARDLTRS